MGEYISVGDTRLYVVERGHGYPLIALHGGPGGDHVQLDGPLASLRDEFRLILVDQRAQGRSDDAPAETWTVRQMAADISSLAEALGLRQYAVLGHSFGALVALEHAVRSPGAAAQTIVSHGVPSLRFYRLTEELERFEPAHLRRRIADAWDQLEAAETSEEMVRLMPRQMPFHVRDPCQPEVVSYSSHLAARQRLSPTVNRHMSRTGYGGFDVENDLAEVTQPVLVLTGRHERTCPLEAAELMAARIPRAELVIFEESAHLSYVEENERYVEVVRNFLRQRGGTKADGGRN